MRGAEIIRSLFSCSKTPALPVHPGKAGVAVSGDYLPMMGVQ